MKKLFALLLVLLVCSISYEANAKVLVLVHGYLGNAFSWEGSGITSVLEAKQWRRAGILTLGPGGVQVQWAPGNRAKNKVYLVELPSAAPIAVQAHHLRHMMWFLARYHPKEPFIVAGHSVGGVVARLALVQGRLPAVQTLVTIASPHLGTPRAEQALDATSDSGPFGIIKDFFGGHGYQTLRHSWGLLVDITLPRPGSLLFWLNNQPHPKIHYVSIVRGGPFWMAGDILVPGLSQNMNNVAPLAGQSALYLSGSGHGLHPGDGLLLVKILQQKS